MDTTRTYHMLSAVDAVKLNFDNFLESRDSVRYSHNDEFFIVKNEGALGNKLANTVPLLSGQTLVQILTALDAGRDGTTTFIDSSLNNFTVTAFGNAQISTVTKKFGNGSAYFDGDGDYLVLPDDNAFDFNNTVCSYCGQSEVLPGSTIPFTIETWFYPTIVDGNLRVILNKGTHGQNGSWGIGFTNTYFEFGTKEGWDVLRYPATVTPNTWHHVAITHNGTTGASAFKFFFNGVQLTNYTDIWDGNFNGEVSNNTGDITIGCAAWNLPQLFFAGYIDELRITKGIARYTANFAPPTSPFSSAMNDPFFNNVSLLMHMNDQTWQYDFEYKYPNVPKDDLVAFFNFDTSLTASDFYYSKVVKGETLSITLADFDLIGTNIQTYNPNGVLNENGTLNGKVRYYGGTGTGLGQINLSWNVTQWVLSIEAYGAESYDNTFVSLSGIGDTEYPWQAYWSSMDGKVLRTPNASDVEFNYIELEPTGNGGIYTYGVTYSGVGFEAQNDRLIYPYNLWNQQENPTSFTVAFWVRRDVPYVLSPPQLTVMCGSVFGPMSFAFTEADSMASRALTFFINLTGGHYQSVRCELSGVTLNTGIWTHLAGTLDTNERVIKMYVNGKLADTNSYASTQRPGVAYISGSPSHLNWNGFALNGSVLASGAEYGNKYKFDNFGLWTRSLNAAEISSLHNHGYGAFLQ